MRKLVTNHIERCVKKKEIQLKTRRETKGMDLWKKKGEISDCQYLCCSAGCNNLQNH